MEKKWVFGIILILIIILVVSYVMKTGGKGKIIETTSGNAQTGLGSLCADETECISFCANNRGICENYCKGKEEQLCKEIFPPNYGIVQAEIKKEKCVSNPAPKFTHPFVDISKISVISRYGGNALVNPGSQVRSYLSVKEGERTPVYAPTNITVTRLYFSNKNYSQFFDKEFIRPEYRIDSQASCEVTIAFDHIVSLSEKLKAYAPQNPSPGKNDGVVVSIPLEAGELIGYTSGSFPGRTFDFIVLNTAKKTEHINPSRWVTDNSLYMGCPYDYYPDNMKKQYIDLIEEIKSKRDCGPSVREVPNTIFGYWFQGDATENEGSRFVISASKHFVEWTIIIDNESPVAYRENEASSIDPESIVEGKTACYYDLDRDIYVFLKMLPNDKLALNYGDGVCPSSFSESKAEYFER